MGGDFQESPEKISFDIINKSENNISFITPNKEGYYRMFVFLKNINDQYSVANIPFRVESF